MPHAQQEPEESLTRQLLGLGEQQPRRLIGVDIEPLRPEKKTPDVRLPAAIQLTQPLALDFEEATKTSDFLKLKGIQKAAVETERTRRQELREAGIALSTVREQTILQSLSNQGLDVLGNRNPKTGVLELRNRGLETFVGSPRNIPTIGIVPFALNLRGNMAAARSFDEKIGIFTQAFPDGTLALATDEFGQPLLVFKRNQEEPFDILDVDASDMPTAINEFFAEVSEFIAPDIGAIIGETALILATRGQSAFRQITAGAAGAAAGELTQRKAVRAAAGVDPELSPSDKSIAALKSIMSLGGQTILAPLLNTARNIKRGANIINLRTGSKQALQFLRDSGLKGADKLHLPINLISRSPFLQRTGRQASSVFARVGDYLERLEFGTREVLARHAESITPDGKIPVSILAQAEEQEAKRILTAQIGSLRGKGKNLPIEKRGERLVETIVRYDASAVARVNIAYNNARLIEEPVFDVANAQIKSATLEKQIRRTSRRVRTDAEIEAGATPTFEVGKIEPELQNIFDDFGRIDAENFGPTKVQVMEGRPDLPTIETSAIDQLNAVRERLGVLSIPMVPAGSTVARVTPTTRGAIKFKQIIDDMMDEVQNANPEFVKAWKEARGLARKRFETREKAIIAEALRVKKTEEFAAFGALFSDLSSPGVVDRIKHLIAATTPLHGKSNQAMNFLRLGIIDDLVRDASSIASKLDAAQPSTLKFLFNEVEEKALRELSRASQRLDQVGISKIVKTQEVAAAAGTSLLRNTKNQSTATNALLEIIENAGGKDSPTGRFVRQSLFKSILKRGQIRSGEQLALNSNLLSQTITDMENSGLIKVFKPAEVGLLKNAEQLKRLLQLNTDAGTSFLAASITRKVGSPTDPLAILGGLIDLVELNTIGRVLTARGLSRLLGGKGAERATTSAGLRAFSGATVLLIDDLIALTQGDLQNNQAAQIIDAMGGIAEVAFKDEELGQ